MRRSGRVGCSGASRRAFRALVGAGTTTSALLGILIPAPLVAAQSSIRARQDNVVTSNYQGPLSLAQLSVAEFTSNVQHDTSAVTVDRQTQAAAEASFAAAASRLGGDQSALDRDVAALTAAQAQLAADRSRLRALAVGMYTGALTNPQPASLHQLEAEQDRVIDGDQVEVVAGVVDGHVHQDLATAQAASNTRDRAEAQVAADQQQQVRAQAQATLAASQTTRDQAALSSDQAHLGQAEQSLDSAEASLASALAAVAGPTNAPAGQLSLLGGAALTATQMAAWYNAQGYVDLTSASINQLAGWYIQYGAEEGVRGDVAFAQAVLETGGFSSPDAVELSNFAGIGHCDTCSSGWAFPSPSAGVLGQIQLLRIFADRGPGPPQAPAPVLSSLVPGQQMSAGCCSTVESLTGVWATDPTYGRQILGIYGSMLSSALTPQ